MPARPGRLAPLIAPWLPLPEQGSCCTTTTTRASGIISMGAMFANLLKTTYQLQQSDKQQQQQPHFSLPRRQVVTYALYALIAVALVYLFVDPAAPSSPAAANPSSSSVAPPWIQEQEDLPPPWSPPPTTTALPPCDYSDGEWVPDPRPPPYNGTTCHAIKDGRSCTANGQTDTGYVHWRWRPRRCDLPAFSPELFLRWLRNRHVAFVGDSLARNQAESLVCLLSSRSPAALVPGTGGDGGRFRRWVFRDHNATVSTFWSPFLVKGAEKSGGGAPYNRVFLDASDERWMSELGAVDAAVLSAGHWFKIPSVYYRDGGAAVVGCHGCAAAGLDGSNHTETSFLAAFRDAVGRTLAEVARRHDHDGGRSRREKVVAVATFSPSHFEGDWSKGAPCPKKRPYRSGEKELGRTEAEMRRIVVEAVEAAAAASSSTLRFATLDVTTLADMRPDGHPGPYMRKNPFAGGGGDGPVQNDCLHWCMPGPVDTFNQILLQTILH